MNAILTAEIVEEIIKLAKENLRNGRPPSEERIEKRIEFCDNKIQEYELEKTDLLVELQHLRSLNPSNITVKWLAEKYGVRPDTIYKIISGHRWSKSMEKKLKGE